MTEDQAKRAVERLLTRCEVDPETGCWHFKGAKVGGYGQVTYEGEQNYTHRISGVALGGFDLTGGLLVLHRCDVPDCLNPEHLFPGTAGDNARDAAAKGRMGKKLVPKRVLEIKRLLKQGCTYRSIAPQYGVTPTSIGQIARGETWRSVNLDETESPDTKSDEPGREAA
jgi:hypothetical protein